MIIKNEIRHHQEQTPKINSQALLTKKHRQKINRRAVQVIITNLQVHLLETKGILLQNPQVTRHGVKVNHQTKNLPVIRLHDQHIKIHPVNHLAVTRRDEIVKILLIKNLRVIAKVKVLQKKELQQVGVTFHHLQVKK